MTHFKMPLSLLLAQQRSRSHIAGGILVPGDMEDDHTEYLVGEVAVTAAGVRNTMNQFDEENEFQPERISGMCASS